MAIAELVVEQIRLDVDVPDWRFTERQLARGRCSFQKEKAEK